MQKTFKDEDIYIILLMLNYMSMTAVEREFGHVGGNKSIKIFLRKNGIDPSDHLVSRSWFMKRMALNKQSEKIKIQEYEIFTDEQGRTIKKYRPAYAWGAIETTMIEGIRCIDLF